MRFCTMNFGKKIVMTTKLRRLLLGRDGGRPAARQRNTPPARGTGRWGRLFALGHGDGGANTCSGVIGSRLCHHGDGVVSGGQVSRNGHIDDVCSRPSEF